MSLSASPDTKAVLDFNTGSGQNSQFYVIRCVLEFHTHTAAPLGANDKTMNREAHARAREARFAAKVG